MFTKSSKKKSAIWTLSGMCQVCSITTIILGVIAILATLAAVIGVFKAHFLSAGLTFGTLNGSASLMALALNIFILKKLSACCPCQCAVKK